MSLIDKIIELKEICFESEQELVKRLKISISEYFTINKMDKEKEFTCNSLSKRLGLSTSRVSRITESLVKKSLLERSENNTDRRIKYLKLTEAGKKIKEEIEKHKLECEKKILDNFNEDEIKKISSCIGQISDLLKKES